MKTAKMLTILVFGLLVTPVLAESESQIVDEVSSVFSESVVAATTTIFSDSFSGSYPGSWNIGHDGGGGNYAWAWPSDYAHCYADPYGSMYYYPDNLHVYMERRNVSLSGYSNASLFFTYIVDTEASWDYFTVNVRDQSGSWHEVWRKSGITDPEGTRTLNLRIDRLLNGSISLVAPRTYIHNLLPYNSLRVQSVVVDTKVQRSKSQKLYGKL